MTENKRQAKGKKIAEKQDQIKRIDNHYYLVKSQSQNKHYDVISTEQGWECSCPDHTFRQICCKHIHAVEVSLQIRETVKQQVIINEINNQSCPNCESSNLKKDEIRHNKNYDIQRFKCKNCDKKFSINLGFEKMKASPQMITSALQLYFTGESLRGVQKFIKLQGINVNHTTIYRWVKKYIKLMDSYLQTITPQVGDKWHADEVWVKINGDKKYLFAMMDNETRFWIAQEVADSKFSHDAQNLLAMGKQVTKKTPSVFVTDGLPAYNKAFEQEYSQKNFLHKPAKHIRDIRLK